MSRRKHTGNWFCLGLAALVAAVATPQAAAQDPAIRVASSGDVGFGTDLPDDGDSLAERFIDAFLEEERRRTWPRRRR